MNYQKRREKVLANLKIDGAVVAVSAANAVQASGSFEYPYRQDSNFRYLCGYNQPGATLIFTEAESLLFVREPDEHDLLWDIAAADTKSLKQQAQVDDIRPLEELPAWIKQNNQNDFYVPQPLKPQHSRAQSNRAQPELRDVIRNNGVKDVKNAQDVLAELRRVKDANEIELIERAVSVTHKAFKNLDVDVTHEYQLESQVTKTFIDHNTRHAYSPIVASGERAIVLHYRDNDAALPDNSMVLIDAGAEVDGYAADVTRMFEIGQPSDLQQQMLEIVSELQRRAVERVKPGVTIRQFATEFRKDLLQEGQQAGFIDSDAAIKDTLKLMPHGVCHYLGLDVHDVGDYDAPLGPGVVLMVEPGLYLFDQKLGVRLEDAVVVTDGGCRVLAESIQ